jgi:hypothetical protein
MGKRYDKLELTLQSWIAEQKIFFVSTAPSSPNGHINCSPKCGDTFLVLSDDQVAYMDLTGSGVETIAHLQENGRMVIMFCAFEGPPKIVRLHGSGDILYPDNPEYSALLGRFPSHPGARAIVRLSISRISDSCGYSVPFFDYVGPRDSLDRWAESKGPVGLENYRREKNRESIDGVPGLKSV